MVYSISVYDMHRVYKIYMMHRVYTCLLHINYALISCVVYTIYSYVYTTLIYTHASIYFPTLILKPSLLHISTQVSHVVLCLSDVCEAIRELGCTFFTKLSERSNNPVYNLLGMCHILLFLCSKFVCVIHYAIYYNVYVYVYFCNR